MRRVLLFAAALAASAGGGAATQAQRAETFRAAQWQLTATLLSLDAPTLPESARQEMRRIIDGMTERQCLGAGTRDPVRELRDGMIGGFRTAVGSGGDCSFADTDTISNGIFRTDAICRAPGNPVVSRITMAGTYTDISIQADMEMTFALPADPPERPIIRVRARIDARAVGPCAPQA